MRVLVFLWGVFDRGRSRPLDGGGPAGSLGSQGGLEGDLGVG